MTAHQETRYHCDRCGGDEVITADMAGPPHQRIAGPTEWLMLRIGHDPATPPRHLCSECSVEFINFMGADSKAAI